MTADTGIYKQAMNVHESTNGRRKERGEQPRERRENSHGIEEGEGGTVMRERRENSYRRRKERAEQS